MNRFVRLITIFLCLWLCGPVGLARGDDECPKVFDASKYMLGRFPIGSDPKVIPGLRQRSEECGRVAEKHYRGIETSKEEDAVFEGSLGSFCYFTDKYGVTYAFDGMGDDPGRIYQIEVQVSAYHGRLFAGIATGDSYLTVYQKLMAHSKDFPSWKFTQDDSPGPYAETSYCIKDSNGEGWSIRLQFDQLNRLKSVAEVIDMRGGDDTDYNDP